MIIEVPLVHNVKVLMGRNRTKADRFSVRGSCMVKVEEPRDAVLAAVMPVDGGAGTARCDVMHWDGSFWTNVTEDFLQAEGHVRRLRAEDLAEAVKGSRYPGATLAWHDPYDYREAAESVASIGAASVLEDTYKTVADAIHRRAADLAVIGGEVFRRVSEPVYVDGFHGTPCETAFLDDVRPVPGQPVQGQRRKVDRIWRADDLDGFIAEHHLADDRRQAAEAVRIEVLRPDLFSWDREAEYLRDRCARLAGGFGAGLAKSSREMFSDFADLRDLVAAEASTSALAEAAGRLVARCRLEDPEGDICGTYLVDSTERAIGSWAGKGGMTPDEQAIAAAGMAP